MSLSNLLLRIMMFSWRLLAPLPPWLRRPLLFLIALLVAALGFVLAIPWMFLGLLRGIWFRISPPPPTRDVSRLSDDEEGLEAVSETIQDEGQPLKTDQRRLIHRDPRLLPKPKPPANVWPRPRKKKVMTSDEANRLFAGTLRTKNRRIRDLLADEDQLARFDLPIWRSEQDIADALEIPVGTLRHYSIHRQTERVSHYITFAIPKRNGGRRLIMAPKQRLKKVQRTLHRLLIAKLPVSEHAHGFRPGRSVLSAAQPHVGKAVVLKLDLKDFFPSITYARVRGLLIALGYGYPVAATLAVLMTESERQPVELDGKVVHSPIGPRLCVQGAPTSPGLSNAICHRLDHRLAGLARKYGWSFTRYADDLTFSGDTPENVHTLRRIAARICREEGFSINPTKTRIMRRGRRQTVTGVVVNDTPGLSRQHRRLLRAALHRQTHPDPNKPSTLTPRQLAGKIAYLHMLNAEQAERLGKRS